MKKRKKDNTYGSSLEKELDSILGTDVQLNPSEPSGKKKKKAKKKNGQKTVAIVAGVTSVILVVAVAGFGVYLYHAQQYKTEFFPGTTINSIDCSNKTVEEIETIIKENVEKYALTVNFRNGQVLTIDGSDIDYTYKNGSDIQDLLAAQNIMDWYKQSKETREYTVDNATTFDETKVAAILDASEELDPIHQTAPEDAYMEFADGKFTIVSEKEGNKLDADILENAVIEAISNGETTLNVDETGAYAKPAVTSEDTELVTQVENLNKYVGASITYKLPQGDKVLDGETMVEWLDKDENGNYTKDDDTFAKKIKEYVAELAEETDTIGSTASFKSTYGTVVKVKTVDTGWKIDQAAEVKALTANIEAGDTVEREPEYKSKMSTTENGGFGDTYIEADLTSQHVYFYKNGKVVWESDCVSGKMTKDRYTPSGVYLLDYKTKDRDLKGEKLPNGEYSYVSHVNYWMPFHGGYGFHDATWRSKFGGTIYNYGGSHGCINLPKSKAATLYDLIDKEVPIVIFYRTDVTLRPAEPKKTSDGEGSSSKKDESSSKDEESSSKKDESSSKKDESSSKKEESSSKKDESSSKKEESSSKKDESSSKKEESSSKTETPAPQPDAPEAAGEATTEE